MELYPFSIQPIKGNNCGLIPYIASQVSARPDHFNFLPASDILPSADILLKQFGPTSGFILVCKGGGGVIIVFCYLHMMHLAYAQPFVY